MARVAEQLGVELRLGARVDRIRFDGRRATGIEADGRAHATDAVVLNADFAHSVPQLIPDAVRKRWNDARIAAARYSCSTFMLYLGIEGTVPALPHHTIVLSRDYMRNIGEIERGILPDTPSFYLQHATASDATMAPAGHASLYLLVPVPNLKCGIDWRREAPRFRALALARLAALGLTDLERRIRHERMVTPEDWRDAYSVGFGATFNLSHDLMQMLCFRPGNRFGDAEGVYLVGGGTHPGSGLPVIYEGARISANLLLADLGLARAPLPASAA
jgi:phytoene desaturase